MTRVRSQKTRQALLVVGDPLDAFELPEKLELFNELGEPLMLGGGSIRYSQDQTSGLLASGQTEADDLEMYPSVRIYKIVTNRPARVRMYPTAAMRDLDSARNIGIKPPPNSGRYLEVVTTTAILELLLSPVVDMTTVDSNVPDFYTSVTNLGTTSGAVVVTYHYFRTE